MAIEISPLEKADLPECFDMAFRSLSENDGPWGLVFPNGMIDADRDHWVDKQTKDWPKSGDHAHAFKAINPSWPTGKQIVGMARWVIYPDCDSLAREAEAKKSLPPASFSPSMDPVYRQAMIDAVFDAKFQMLKDQAFVHLHVMVVHPDAQRQGVGAALMRWGVERADALELQAYVEATLAGRGLYEKSGFRVVRTARTPGKWEQDDRALHFFMIRPKSGKQNQTT